MALTSEGLEIPTVEALLSDMADELRGEIDPTLDTSPESPQGQILGIVASHLREAWEALAVAFNIDPSQAEGFLLDWVCALTGTYRRGATKSQFRGARQIEVNLDAGTTLPIGSVAHVDGKPDVRFVTTEEVSNPGPGAADVLVTAEAEEAGPVVCNANTLTVIATPVVGWNTVNNPTDCEQGQLREEDAELRVRREAELRKPGTGTVDAIAVDLETIAYEGEEPVLDCKVFENTSMVTDLRGLPAKSFECLVLDGLDAALPNNVIAQAIWNAKPGGIRSFGNTSGTALDRNGKSHSVGFSRPTIVPVGIALDIRFNVLRYAGDAAFAVYVAEEFKKIAASEMLVTWSDAVRFAMAVPGVVRVTTVWVYDYDLDPFTDYQMPLRTYPLFDSGDIVVTGSAE